jgi:sugar/nucleoside kinase (ribokinase family)
VGRDPLDNFVLDEYSKRGISVKGVRIDPEVGTSATMAMVEDDGEWRFIHYIGALHI